MEIIINTPVFLPLSLQSLFDNRIKEIWPERAAKDVSWEKSHSNSHFRSLPLWILTAMQ